MGNYQLFFHDGEVTEIRAIGVSGKNSGWEGFAKSIVSGYYNDPDAFDKGSAILDKAQARGVYFTINPVNPALIARANNRLKVPKSTSQDTDIACIRWLPIDMDPKRPADISSTDEEVARAEAKGKAISEWLEQEIGFAKGIRARSGNGFHLLYRLPDLPNNEETHKIIVAAMAAIKAKFDDDQVDIDSAIANPARIWKCYGTTGRKGDATADRPHRISSLFPKQPAALDDVPITELETLKKLAALVPVAPATTGVATNTQGSALPVPAKTPAPARQAKRFKESTLGPINMEAYLSHYGVAFAVKSDGACTRYILDTCLFNPDHTGGQASICASPTGPLTYQCFHSGCKKYKWADARRKISGDKSIAEFCAGYDPNWKPSNVIGSGTGILSSLQVQMYPDLLAPETDDPIVPLPEEIDVAEFFEIRNGREVFIALNMAHYLVSYLSPIVCTDGFFWRYSNGVWKKFPRTKVVQYIVLCLKKKASGAHINNAMEVFMGIINREEVEWPAHPEYINLINGTFDVEKMELMQHDPDHGCRTILPVRYDPKAFSLLWEDFLKDIFPDDNNYEKRGLLMQFFGYCLLRDCRFQQALFCYGTGSNGKSTVIDVLMAMVGAENTSALTLGDMAKQFRTQLLQEKMVNMASETNLRDPVATETLKQAITGDMIIVERKHGPPYQFRPYAKFLISMNDSPVIPDKSHGFSRRIAVLGFIRRIEKEEIVPDMSKRIIQEIDGVFRWAVEGLTILKRNNGFVLGDKIQAETEAMMETLNPLLIFVNEMAIVEPGARCSTTDAWDAYKYWCKEGKNRALGRNRFLGQITQTFPKVENKQIREEDTDQRIQSLIGFGLTPKTIAWLIDIRRRRGEMWDRESGDEGDI